MFFTLTFPTIDPVLIQIGPLAIRWYALAYIVGLLLGWRYCLYLADRAPRLVSRAQLDDFLLWATLGVIFGGRVGYVLFYQPLHFVQQPLDIFYVWEGGMSFHGGLIGVILAMYLFARRQAIPFFALTDIVACATPIGLLLGRIANFINGELYGRASDAPWAMVFPDPNAGGIPRHPSQLYEAGLEGLLLFLIMFLMMRSTRAMERIGRLSGIFLIGYGLSRIVVEFFREPDMQLGYLLGDTTTMGQILSLPMIAFGLFLVLRARPMRPSGQPTGQPTRR
jgi:phosphatidylglycerol:prolipoprotein diacylglycerol transferase